jgi:dTDP-4-dehydrorhamnose reductase
MNRPLKILLTGASGYVGGELTHSLIQSGHQVFGTGRKNLSGVDFPYWMGDLCSAGYFQNLLTEITPDVVVHCAASKDVRWCESNPLGAQSLNAALPAKMAAECFSAGINFCLISTDFVFEGTRGGYKENEPTAPRTVYGKTKAMAEELVTQENPKSIILRTSGVFSRKSPVFTWLRDQLLRDLTVNCFTDVRNSPTYAADLTKFLERALEAKIPGVFHAVGAERVNRLQWFQAFVTAAGLPLSLLKGVEIRGSPDAAFFLPDSSLDGALTYQALGWQPRSLAQAFYEMHE